jgi:mRNA-degrading endonuclease RelE of RelBE toxin-antitoxin system
VSFEIKINKNVAKFLDKVKSKDKDFYKQILKTLQKIRDNSFRGKPLGNKFKHNFSIRVRHYRIIYTIDGSKVKINEIVHRDDAYK